MQEQDQINNAITFRQLIQKLPAAVYTTDENGVLTFYNDKAAELWRCRPRLNDPTEKRFCGSHRLYNLNGNPIPRDRCGMAEALKSRQHINGMEVLLERPDGSRINISVSISPLYEGDRFVGAVNVFEDITDHKKAEEAKWRLAAIVESSEDAIVSKSLQGIIQSWNKGAESIFGYSKEEILGKSITTIIPPDRLDEESMILNRIRRGEKVSHFETVRITKDGHRIPVSLTISPVKDSRGRIIAASKIARDISDQVNIRNRLMKINEELINSNRYKDQFIGMASHELKTPITVIKSNLQLVDLKVSEEDVKPLVDKTLENVEKLNSLVSDLLDVSKIDSGKLQLNYSDFSVIGLIRDCIQNMRLICTTHRIDFDEPTQDIVIQADKERVEQVVVNLLTNAVKYSPESNRVLIQADLLEDNNVLIKVTDFGIGINESQINKIFSRFYRVKDLAPTFSGLGIGLFISREIVERHGGKIWVASKVDEGSTFHISLPIRPAQQQTNNATG